MEISGYLLSVVVMTSLIVISTSMSLPAMEHEQESQVEAEDQQDKRATWMNTRDLEDDFVGLVEMALHTLSKEGRINPQVVPTDVAAENSLKQKRGKFQGFCFRKTATGRFLPYVCWKSDRRRK